MSHKEGYGRCASILTMHAARCTWWTFAFVVPIVIDALGSIPSD